MREAFDDGRSGPADLTPDLHDLQAALAGERERVREVDHRANNSLQLISSLLVLASRRSAQPETRRALEAMHHRVMAIAAAHRELMGGARPDRFDLTRFLGELVATLVRAHGSAAEVSLELEPVEVEAAAAAPLALIINELVSNALSHTGAAGRARIVTVSLRRRGAGFALTVQDDGPGLAPAAASAGFGLTMVRLLAQQLQARFVLEDAQPGVRAVVTDA